MFTLVADVDTRRPRSLRVSRLLHKVAGVAALEMIQPA
jgi:hypothetical protein